MCATKKWFNIQISFVTIALPFNKKWNSFDSLSCSFFIVKINYVLREIYRKKKYFDLTYNLSCIYYINHRHHQTSFRYIGRNWQKIDTFNWNESNIFVRCAKVYFDLWIFGEFTNNLFRIRPLKIYLYIPYISFWFDLTWTIFYFVLLFCKHWM